MGLAKILIEEKFLRIFLILYVCIQPVLDTFWLNDGSIEIFGFTIPTVLRFSLGFLMFFLCAITDKNKKHIGIYMICVAIYAVLHHMHCASFESLVPGDFNYNVVNELFYIFRMTLPIMMIYVSSKDIFDKNTFKAIGIWISALITGLIVITNLLEISLASYTNEIIAGNIFDWFIPEEYGYRTLASKGYFYSSITATLLLLYLPFNISVALKNTKLWILVFFQTLACFMVGTKAMTLGALIIIFLSAVLYVFFSIIKRDLQFGFKNVAVFVVLVLCFVSLYPHSPSYARTNFDAAFSAAKDEKEQQEKDSEGAEEVTALEYSYDDEESMIRYLDMVYPYVSITERYISISYSYKYDPLFWCQFLENTVPSQRMQNRFVQQSIFERVKDINDNSVDDWFGIGYSRTSNIFNLERDFLYQFYSIGLVGIIVFLCPYILILLGFMLKMLIRFKSHFTFENCMLCIGVGLTLFSAYYSGNTLESLGITIPFAVFMGFLLKEIKPTRIEEKE